MADPTVDQLPAALSVATDCELPARIVVHDLRGVGVGEGHIALVLGDDLRRVSFIGPLEVVHRLIVEADRQLTRLAQGDR